MLTPAKKNVRKRGKRVYLKDRNGNDVLDKSGHRKEKFAKGSSVRGLLHKETFYGQIKIAKKENGSLIRNEAGEIVFNRINGEDEIWAVIRIQVTDSKFNAKNIVDDSLREYVLKQLESKNSNELIDFSGKKIRHIRCRVKSGKGFMNPKNLTKVKRQTYLSDKEYKNFYYADSGANYLFGLYETSKGKREVKAVNVFSAAKINSLKPVRSKEELFEPNLCIGAKKEIAKLIHVFQEGQKVIFFFESKEELKELPLGELSKRLYFVRRLHQATIGNIQFQHHLEARTDEELVKAFPKDKYKSAGKDGFSKFQKDFIAPRLLFKPTRDEFVIEKKDFLFHMDGSIKFLF